MVNRRAKAFTLIEVVITIALITILSSIILPKYNAYRNKIMMNKAIFMGKEINQVALISYVQQEKCFKKSALMSLIQGTTEINPVDGDIVINPEDSSIVTIAFSYQDKIYYVLIQANIDYKIFTLGRMIFEEEEST
jgi:prepilin-type N-terminal cleavage/methylation domain-containing protein